MNQSPPYPIHRYSWLRFDYTLAYGEATHSTVAPQVGIQIHNTVADIYQLQGGMSTRGPCARATLTIHALKRLKIFLVQFLHLVLKGILVRYIQFSVLCTRDKRVCMLTGFRLTIGEGLECLSHL